MARCPRRRDGPVPAVRGHSNQLAKFKKQYPDVKTLISVGGWAETGGILNPGGSGNATSAGHAGNPDDFWISDANRGTLMTGYVNLMRTLRSKLDAASVVDGKHYLLTDLHGSWNHFVGRGPVRRPLPRR